MRGVPHGKRLLMMVACLLGIVGLLCAATTATANAKHYANDYALTAIDNNAMPASEVAAVEKVVCVRAAIAAQATHYVIIRQQRLREGSCERQARQHYLAGKAVHAIRAPLFRRGVTITGR